MVSRHQTEKDTLNRWVQWRQGKLVNALVVMSSLEEEKGPPTFEATTSNINLTTQTLWASWTRSTQSNSHRHLSSTILIVFTKPQGLLSTKSDSSTKPWLPWLDVISSNDSDLDANMMIFDFCSRTLLSIFHHIVDMIEMWLHVTGRAEPRATRPNATVIMDTRKHTMMPLTNACLTRTTRYSPTFDFRRVCWQEMFRISTNLRSERCSFRLENRNLENSNARYRRHQLFRVALIAKSKPCLTLSLMGMEILRNFNY